jgi:hypothetical protein
MTPFRYIVWIMLLVGITGLALNLSSQESSPARKYVGQESCLSAGCHAGPYGDESTFQGAGPFRQTMHQQIHLRPTPQTVVIDRLFDNDTILRYRDPRILVPGMDTLEIHLSKGQGRNDYYIGMRFSGGDSTPAMKVAYTYGGNGWIQRYLVEVDGNYYVAPFQYILPGYRVRSSYGGSFFYLDRDRWYAIDSNTFEPRFYSRSSNIFRSKSWDRACAACHVNGFDIEQRAAGGDTTWQALWVGVREGDSALRDENIKIGCESCHGPGSEHAANPTAENIISPRTFPNTVAGTDLRLDLCNQCHNRVASTGGTYAYPYDETNHLPYIPGIPLAGYIRDPFANAQNWPDRVTSYAHHQQGQDFARSKPYAAHIFQNGCWSCHLVHTPGKDGLPYQLDRNWYSLTKGEGCLAFGCHETFGDSALSAGLGRMVNTHTQHSPGVSQCVNCHFTKTATIAFDQLPGKPLYEFSSHGFKVLRPVLTRELAGSSITGMVNSCAEGCHRNGRGSRNYRSGDPEAPDFGTDDRNIASWKDAADIELADSLWYHYQKMYAKYLGDVRGEVGNRTKIAVVRAAPNPFQGSTRIEYTLPRAGDIELAIYDLQGRLVRMLAAGRHEAGEYAVKWDGADELGSRAAGGAYLVRLRAGDASASATLTLHR